VDGRQLVAIVLRRHSAIAERDGPGISAHARMLDVADVTAAACRGEQIPALVGTLDDVQAGAMLSLGPRAPVDQVLTTLATRIRERLGTGHDGLVIGVGATVGSIREVRRSFLEASQVAEVAAGSVPGLTTGSAPAGPGQPFYRLPDLHLRGLLHLLRDDARLEVFIERELGALLHHERRAELLAVLRAYLEAGGNKAEAAKNSHLARPTFYDRLHRIERVLGVDLTSAETRTSLHVALLAQDFPLSGSGTPGRAAGTAAPRRPGSGTRARA
jgi:PucR family transcriptional regulator, purine catabolism regulatory protein